MKILKVTSGGRITLPVELRKKYGIKTGTRVNFIEEKDGIKIILLTYDTIKAYTGFLGTNGRLLKSLMEEKKREREL